MGEAYCLGDRKRGGREGGKEGGREGGNKWGVMCVNEGIGAREGNYHSILCKTNFGHS